MGWRVNGATVNAIALAEAERSKLSPAQAGLIAAKVNDAFRNRLFVDASDISAEARRAANSIRGVSLNIDDATGSLGCSTVADSGLRWDDGVGGYVDSANNFYGSM